MDVIDLSLKTTDKQWDWWIFLGEMLSTTPRYSFLLQSLKIQAVQDEEAWSKLSREISEMPRLNT